MQNVGGFGLKLRLTASRTLPSGITLTQFADDADPFDLPAVVVAQTAMGLNGDLITWSSPAPLVVTINVIPGSDDDRTLAAIFEANRVGRNKASARDVITLASMYPGGNNLTLSEGVMTSGMPGDSVASAGRKKSKAYVFAFEGLSRAG